MSIYTTPGGINLQPRTLPEHQSNWQKLVNVFRGDSNLIINADGSISAPPVSPDPNTPILVDSLQKIEAGTYSVVFPNGSTAGLIYQLQQGTFAYVFSAANYKYGMVIGQALDTVAAGGTGRLRVAGFCSHNLFSNPDTTLWVDGSGNAVGTPPTSGWLIPLGYCANAAFGYVFSQGPAIYRSNITTPKQYLSIASNGTIVETSPLQTSNGTGSAGALVALNANGVIDSSMILSSSGTVTSVGLTAPSFLTVGGSPITTSGNLTLVLATQTANTVFAGPTSGNATAPAFRTLVAADVPTTLGNITIGNLTVTGTITATFSGVLTAAGFDSTALTWQTPAPSLLSTSGWVVTVDSNGSNLGNPIDGSSGFPPQHGSCANGSWFKIDMLSNVTVSSVEFDSLASTTVPNHYKIEYSTDNVTYTVATASIAAVQNTLYTPGAAFTARYLKYTADSATSNGNWYLKQLKVMGVAVGAAAASAATPTVSVTSPKMIRISGMFKKNAGTDDFRITLGDSTAANGYRLNWTSGGVLKLEKVISSTATAIGNTCNLATDTALHTAVIWIKVSASNDVSIIATIDNVFCVQVTSDTAYDLTAAANTITAWTGDTTKLYGWSVDVGADTDCFQGGPATQTNGTFFAGNAAGTPGAPSFRAIIANDLPATLNDTTFANATITNNLTIQNINMNGNLTANATTTLAGNVTMSGTTTTVSSALTISNATTTHGVGDRFTATLGSDYTTTTSNANVGLSVTLPAAGTYRVWATIRVYYSANLSTGSSAYVVCGITNTTDAINYVNRLICYFDNTTGTLTYMGYQGIYHLEVYVTVSAASKVINLQASKASSSTGGVGIVVLSADTNLNYERIA